nr:carbohydrate-binding domain-containing protein [Lachnospiraceae bacterium]
GYDLSILSGNINITAADDAIHADRILTVGEDDTAGPVITINSCTEGLEGTVVNLFSGNVSVNSSDDGINAANKEATYADELAYSINVTGGTVSVNTSGDGLDSNGDINLTGGTISIRSANAGGEAGIDFDGSYYVSENVILDNANGVSGPDMMPGNGNVQMPGNGNGQMPGNGNGQMPGNGNGQMPGNGNVQMPGNGNGQMPGNENVQMPGNMNGQMPGNMNGQMPGNGNTQMPGHWFGTTDDNTNSSTDGMNGGFSAPWQGNPAGGSADGSFQDGTQSEISQETTPGGSFQGTSQGGNPPEGKPGNPGNGHGFGGSSNVSYTAVETISSDTTESGKTVTSETADESALLVTGGTVTENGLTVKKTGSSNGGDSCNFYGQNAAILAKDGAVLYINGADIYSNASGANGVFSYGGNGGRNGAAGDGTTVYISDSTIVTEGNGSGGIMTTGGGTTYASNLSVTTSGQSSAAIRTDRGGGTVTVDGGTYTTNGLGSPAIYSTADITVKNAELISTLSEGVVIEGKNTVTLENVNLTTNNTKTNSNATHYDSIFMYQSMSGDADSGTSVFSMTDGSITNMNGEVFHVTNTNAVINLKNVEITNKDADNTLITVTNDGWSGSDNIATVNADSQKLAGSIIVSNTAVKDSKSSKLTLNLTGSSVFEGNINTDEADRGTVDVSIDEGSVWKLTADSYVDSVTGKGQIDYNGHTLYVGDEAYTSDKPVSSSDSTGGQLSSGSNKETSIKIAKKTISADALESSSKSYYAVKNLNGGTVSVDRYYKNASDYISVSSKGKITVKKGTPAGVYKVKVKVTAADGSTITKMIRIKVK